MILGFLLLGVKNDFGDYIELFFLRSIFCGLDDGSVLLFFNFFLWFDFGMLVFFVRFNLVL